MVRPIILQKKKPKGLSVNVVAILIALAFVSLLVAPLLHLNLTSVPDCNDTIPLGQSELRRARKVQQVSPDECCGLARKDSNSFFSDVPDETWQIKKSIYKSMQPNHEKHTRKLRVEKNEPNVFWNNNFEPEFTCGLQQRLGGLGDGGKWVCNPSQIDGSEKCLIYSIGSNGNAVFEKAMHNVLKNCQSLEIHTFDLKGWNKRNGAFADRVNEAGGTFHQWGITVDEMNFTRPEYFIPKVYRTLEFKTFGQTFNELGHTGRVVDVMKLGTLHIYGGNSLYLLPYANSRLCKSPPKDCEGCEWQSVHGWLRDWKAHNVVVRQILIELHDSPYPEVTEFFATLKQAGYVIFHKEVTGSCAEYAFVKLEPSFFE
jgi:hypothetical protein